MTEGAGRASILVNDLPVQEIRKALVELLTDPNFDSPECIKVNDSLVVNFLRYLNYNRCDAVLELVVATDLVTEDLVSEYGKCELNEALLEKLSSQAPVDTELRKRGSDNGISDNQWDQYEKTVTTADETVPLVEISSFFKGMLAQEGFYRQSQDDSRGLEFTYIFNMEPDGEITEVPHPARSHTPNLLDTTAHVFQVQCAPKYTIEDLPCNGRSR